jgi:type IV pilus assembly protein PilV
MMLDSHRSQRGVSLIEVLIAMVILAIGLLGLVGLQGRLHVTQVESYQRAQALILLQDMTNRIALNRTNAAAYVTAEPLGIGMEDGCPIADVDASRVERDVSEWCQYLIGASEETAGGSQVGAMVGGRGCVDAIGPDEYLITVTWQGLAPTVAPPVPVDPDIVPCGTGEYDGPANSPCEDDLCRRAVTTILRISDLTPT